MGRRNRDLVGNDLRANANDQRANSPVGVRQGRHATGKHRWLDRDRPAGFMRRRSGGAAGGGFIAPAGDDRRKADGGGRASGVSALSAERETGTSLERPALLVPLTTFTAPPTTMRAPATTLQAPPTTLMAP